MISAQNNSQNRGKEGERWAVEYLKKEGYKILETNWRFKKLEVDIISEHEGFIIFVEVKTRKSSAFGAPESFVTKTKQQFLIKAAHHYLTSKHLESEARFDIISIENDSNSPTVKHLQAAFYPSVK